MIVDAVKIFAKALIMNETIMSEFKINPAICYKYPKTKDDEVSYLNGGAILDSINNVIDLCWVWEIEID